jgi:hypothetical protein
MILQDPVNYTAHLGMVFFTEDVKKNIINLTHYKSIGLRRFDMILTLGELIKELQSLQEGRKDWVSHQPVCRQSGRSG